MATADLTQPAAVRHPADPQRARRPDGPGRRARRGLPDLGLDLPGQPGGPGQHPAAGRHLGPVPGRRAAAVRGGGAAPGTGRAAAAPAAVGGVAPAGC
ncbi:hypothetical protein V2I01_33540 [Micromonospora sp. BRA006-A]|nr:hypothetical protein [Micromonospora sp. BRA006-A]